MTAEQFVVDKFPEAEIRHRRMWGATWYAVFPLNGSRAFPMERTASKAWTTAKKAIVEGKEPERTR